MKKSVTLLLAGLLAFAGCDAYESFTVQDPGWYPEGIAFDAGRNEFLVTSVSRGTVSRVTPEGKSSVLINDQRFRSAIGIKIDRKRKRILVANGDPGFSERSTPDSVGVTAGLGVYKLGSGEEIRYINLAEGLDGARLANDMIVDKRGNIYVTDSFAPVIYKVDLNYNVEIFVSSPEFVGDGFNLNGLVYSRKGDFLLVAKGSEGRLFRIPLKDPYALTEVDLDLPLIGADGLVLLPDGRLAVVQNSMNQVSLLVSGDDWATATTDDFLTNDLFEFPTTAVLVGHNLMTVNGKLNFLLDGTPDLGKEFEIISHSPFKKQ